MNEYDPNYFTVLDEDIWNVVVNGTSDQRKYICEREPLYFAMFYFAEYFEYALDDFHYTFIEDFKNLVAGTLTEAQWIAFRESAKTTLAKILTVWAICYAHKRYISYGSYERGNAESALYDIIIWLQTNQRIIADFGLLYKRRKKRGDVDEVSTTRKDHFVTTNKVRVIAFSTQESTRGHVFNKFRPDLYVYDDIENSKTKDSHARTQAVIEHLDEARSGQSSYGAILYLCNYIRDDGSVQHIKDKLEASSTGVVRNIPVMDNKGNLAWNDKYVLTKKEAWAINKFIDNKRLHKVSVEGKKEQLGDSVFFTEMMNEPGKSGDYYFNRDKVREAMEKVRDPLQEIGGQQIWEKYNASHRYALGADTSEGIGSDSSATAIIDFTRSPGLVVATFADNQISPKVFAHEIAREGRRYGECFVVPEVNNGYGVTADLVDPDGCDYSNVYIRQVKNKTTKKTQSEYGFNTNSKTKGDILSHFQSAFEDGHLEIFDKGLLTEMMYFRKADAHRIKNEEGATRHFDKVMAAALAWEGRKFATAKNDDDDDIYTSPQTKEDEARAKGLR